MWNLVIHLGVFLVLNLQVWSHFKVPCEPFKCIPIGWVTLYLIIDYLWRNREINCSHPCVLVLLIVNARMGCFILTMVLYSSRPPSAPALLFPVMTACLAIPYHWPSHNRFINIALWAICRFWFPGTRLGIFDGKFYIKKKLAFPPSKTHWPFELRAILILLVWHFFAGTH